MVISTFFVFFAEATLKSKKSSYPPRTSNNTLPHPKPAPKCQPAVRQSTNIRPSTNARPPSRPADPKVTLLNKFQLLVVFSSSMSDSFYIYILYIHCLFVLFSFAKATPRVAKAQNGRPAATRQPLKKTFKNVDSRLANLILNEIVDRCVSQNVTPVYFS